MSFTGLRGGHVSYLERTLSYGCHIFDTRCKSKSGNSDKGDGT